MFMVARTFREVEVRRSVIMTYVLAECSQAGLVNSFSVGRCISPAFTMQYNVFVDLNLNASDQ